MFYNKPFETTLFIRLAQIIYYNEDLVKESELFKSYEDLSNYMKNKDYNKILSKNTEKYKKDIDVLNSISRELERKEELFPRAKVYYSRYDASKLYNEGISLHTAKKEDLEFIKINNVYNWYDLTCAFQSVYKYIIEKEAEEKQHNKKNSVDDGYI